MTAIEGEILKMMVNSYSALRVVFANHIYAVSQHTGADYDKIEHAYNLVEHSDQNYLKVNDHLRAFGGKCLPKDLQFLIETFDQLNLPQTLLTSTQNDNQHWPITVRKDV
jgi:UDPglucose 6-dehydrogenase